MMTKLLHLSKKNKVFEIIIKLMVVVCMAFLSFLNEMQSLARKIGIPSTFKSIKQLNHLYTGKRCFIICTGPSLTVEDLNKLKNEYTFGMNSICLLSDKSDFRPSFYGVIDAGVFRKLKIEILKYCSDSTQVFVSDRISRIEKLPDSWNKIPVNVAYHTYDRWFKNKFWCKFSDDAYVGLYDMYSVTHFLIQMAVYMGFTEIYLLGCDCNQVKGKQVHFKDYGVPDASIDTARERNISGFEEVKRYCDKHNAAVYNATRGGMLEVFRRVNFDSLFEEDN